MNRPQDPCDDDLTDRLAGSYRAQRESPPPLLDELILAKAKRAAERRRVARLRALGGSFALAATMVLGLALALQVLVTPAENEVPYPQQMQEQRAVTSELDRAELPSAAPAAKPSPPAMDAAPIGAATGAVATPPPAPSAIPVEDAAERRARIAADIALEQVERVEVTGARVKRTQLEGAQPVATLSAESEKSAAGTATAAPAASAVPAAPGIEARLAEIDRLTAAGETAAAATALAEFCREHPDHPRCVHE